MWIDFSQELWKINEKYHYHHITHRSLFRTEINHISQLKNCELWCYNIFTIEVMSNWRYLIFTDQKFPLPRKAERSMWAKRRASILNQCRYAVRRGGPWDVRGRDLRHWGQFLRAGHDLST